MLHIVGWQVHDISYWTTSYPRPASKLFRLGFKRRVNSRRERASGNVEKEQYGQDVVRWSFFFKK